MKGTLSRGATLGLAVLALGLGACDGVPANPADSQVEIVDWWTAGGEKDAINALLALFQQQYPNETPLPMPIEGSTDRADTIQTRMNGGDPPDTFQANAGWDLLAWVLYNDVNDNASKMDPIVPGPGGVGRRVMPKAVLDTVTFNNNYYGVPLDIHRTNTLFYNTALLPSFATTRRRRSTSCSPSTAGCEQTASRPPSRSAPGTGRSPSSFSRTFWSRARGPTSIRIHDRERGSVRARDHRRPRRSGDPAHLRQHELAQLTWSQAADRVLNGDAALTIMGDWVKAYMMSLVRRSPGPEAGPTDNVRRPPHAGHGRRRSSSPPTPSASRAGRPTGQARSTCLPPSDRKAGQDIFNPAEGLDLAAQRHRRHPTTPWPSRRSPTFDQASEMWPRPPSWRRPRFMDRLTWRWSVRRRRQQEHVIHTIANYYDILRPAPCAPCVERPGGE